MDTQLPPPDSGRTFASRRRVRLADADVHGRLRLDAVARFLQDIAIDDVDETGWGAPGHLWFVRRIVVDVVQPFLADTAVDLVTWCSGEGPVAAGRRWSVTGDRGGRIEVDSVWIHLDSEQRPARLAAFGVYGEAGGGRRVSTHLELPDPPADGARRPWTLRVSDLDRHGHVNNAVHWQAVEHALPRSGLDPREPLRVSLDYRHPIDVGEDVELVEFDDEGRFALALVTSEQVKAVARVEPLPPRE